MRCSRTPRLHPVSCPSTPLPRTWLTGHLTRSRYIRAFEVGVPPTSAKYDVAIRLKTLKSGPVVRNRMRLPHPVKTDLRICVIAPPDSKAREEAKAAGAAVIGEEDVFEAIKDGNINFDRCICHVDSFQKMARAGLGRILGPRGLMPSPKVGTVVKDIAGTVRDMVGGTEYRERQGVVRMSIGQLGFTPDEVRNNMGAFMSMIRKDMNQMSDRISKDIQEVVCILQMADSIIANGYAGSQLYPLARLPPQRRVSVTGWRVARRALYGHLIVSYLYHIVNQIQRQRYAHRRFINFVHHYRFDMLFNTCTASLPSSISR
jgi:large subunit ribosomal protein L1